VNKPTYVGSWIFCSWILVATAAASGFGCAGVKPHSSTGSGGSGVGTGTGLTTGSGGSGVVMPMACNSLCTDFPPDPINTNIPAIDPGMFGTPSGAGPCVTEPEDGSLFPNNWLRPRVRVPGAAYLKITIHADLEANDLVAYASGESWKMPLNIWQGLASHVVQQPVSVTVQLPSGGATTVKFQIAPVAAGGSMVFWSADPSAVGKNLADPSITTGAIVNDSYLDGFTVGDESTIAVANGKPVLAITDVQQPTVDNNGNTRTTPRCIGCHAGTPDGDYVAFNDFWPWSAAFAGVTPNASSAVGYPLPGYGGATCTNWNTCLPTCAQGSTCTGGRTYVQEPWGGAVAFSPAHWSIGGTDRVAIMATQLPDPTMPWSQNDKDPARLVWMDTNSTSFTMINGVPVPLQGTAWGPLLHTGDLGGVAFPTWSNDGTTIVYSSTAGATGDQDGRLNQGTTDLYSIPYNDRAGGTATKVPGGSSTGLEEYYAAFAPDDSMLAYTAVPAGQVMYANQQAELYVAPFGASNARTPTRLVANDPPACTGLKSPGVNNHWPKWSPNVQAANGSTFYWIIFSSNRYGTPPVSASNSGTTTVVQVSQLYITAVTISEVGVITTYPAIYLWNQPLNRLNTTPAWQNFNIPIIIG
jgi:WD40-like Beta Propeller Repeat